MKKFLELVAEDLYNKYGNDLSDIVVIFPNKRASLFFREYLAQLSIQPLWSPLFMSISELFQQTSELKIADPILLTCKLYEIFKQETGSNESIDDFYFWGQMLIADFDDVDKNMVDAQKLFTNLNDLQNIIDTYDFLDEEQEKAIQKFFEHFSIEQQTELKQRFGKLWEKLGDIYSQYKQELFSKGIAYEGMLYRQVMECAQPNTFHAKKYLFVGFNVLNKVEIALFELLKSQNKALFYWDYDKYYTDKLPGMSATPEAGEFIMRNLKSFPNELPPSCFNNMAQPKKITYISAPTENAQVRYLNEWGKTISTNETNERNITERENAVILCNESLLLPVLYSIPETVKHINITMGFPLSQTPIFSLISQLLELHLYGYNQQNSTYRFEYLQPLLKHPYILQLSNKAHHIEKHLRETNKFFPPQKELQQDDILTLIFQYQPDPLSIYEQLIAIINMVSNIYRKEENTFIPTEQLYKEALFKAFTIVNRIKGLTATGELDGLQTSTHIHLLKGIMASTNIPFHGEPIIGMQIMGVLETRNLDFKNIVMLSVNEGQLPKSSPDASFVPYNLRKAFGMTTSDHKNAVFAYYFYRLLQRAENITLLYNTASEGLNRGEMSRLMLQLLVESPHPIIKKYIDTGQSPMTSVERSVKKTPELMIRMIAMYDASNKKAKELSPTSLNTYLDCKLKFYYRYILELYAPQEVNSDIDNALFGSIFHYSAEMLYNDLKKKNPVINQENIEHYLNNEYKLQGYVNKAFQELFFKTTDDNKLPEYDGTQLINSKVIVSYLKQLLRLDKRYTPFTMIENERKISQLFYVHTSYDKKFEVKIGGKIDRMDMKDGVLRIVDYKTGGHPNNPVDMEQIFEPSEKRPHYAFQTFLYASIIQQEGVYKQIAPALLYIHKAYDSENYSPIITIGKGKEKVEIEDFNQYKTTFDEYLNGLLNEIFSMEGDFTQTEVTSHCEYCDFKLLCQR